MRLQKSTRIALCSLLELAAEPARQMSVLEMSSRYGISPHHLAKVLQRLVRARLLESVRGVGGGYRFCGNARRLTLLDVIGLFEHVGPEAPARGRSGRRAAPRDALGIERGLERVLAEVDEIARATFRSITLDTMLKIARRARDAG